MRGNIYTSFFSMVLLGHFANKSNTFQKMNRSFSLSRSPIFSHFLRGSPLPPIPDSRIPQLKVPCDSQAVNEKDHLPESWSWSVPSTLVVKSMLPPGQVGNQVGWAMFPNSLDSLEYNFLWQLFYVVSRRRRKTNIALRMLHFGFVIYPSHAKFSKV